MLPIGPTSAYRGQSLTYRTISSDPDGDQMMYFRFEWGDGTPLYWSQYYYGNQYSESHAFTRLGTFYIKAQAMDNMGAASAWSSSCSLTVANNPPAAPYNPYPNDGSSIYATYYTLGWTATDLDSQYDTVRCDLKVDTLNPPVRLVASNLTSSYSNYSFYISGLLPTRTYYWNVVARDGGGAETAGPVWSFITGTKK